MGIVILATAKDLTVSARLLRRNPFDCAQGRPSTPAYCGPPLRMTPGVEAQHGPVNFFAMKTFTTEHDGHRIEVAASIWTGKERVRYDGETVAEGRRWADFSVYSFAVEEGGERAVYEVNLFSNNQGGPAFLLRRNGIILAHEP